MSEIWPGGDHQYSNNLGLSLWGADPVVIENFLTIDTAFVALTTNIDINGVAVPNPNFVNSASVTFSVVGSNVHATAAGGGSGAWASLTGDLTETQVIPWDGSTPGTKDSGISRLGAASLAIGNGTAGDTSGQLNLTTLGFADGTKAVTSTEFANYTFYVSSGTVYAKNGTTGAIDFSNTDAAVVINDCLAQIATTGGTLYFKNGTYNFNSATVETLGTYSGNNFYWCVGIPPTSSATFRFVGESQSGVAFNVTTAAETAAGSGHFLSAFFARPASAYDSELSETIWWGPIVEFRNLYISFQNNQRGNEVHINCLEASYLTCIDVNINYVTAPAAASAAGNTGINTPATFCDGCHLRNTIAAGCYYGIEVNGEHATMGGDVVAYLCTVGFTYGRQEGQGAQSIKHASNWDHIEVYFCANGVEIGPYAGGNTLLNILAYDLEYTTTGPWAFVTAMTEYTPGQCGGVINFTCTVGNKYDLANLFTYGGGQGKNFAVTQLGYGSSDLGAGIDLSWNHDIGFSRSTPSSAPSPKVAAAAAAASVNVTINVGDCVIVLTWNNYNGTPTVGDNGASGGNTYTKVNGPEDAYGALCMFVCESATKTATTVTQSGATAYYATGAMTFGGVTAVTGNQSASANTSAGTPASQSVTTGSPNAFVVGGFSGNIGTPTAITGTIAAQCPEFVLMYASYPTPGTGHDIAMSYTGGGLQWNGVAVEIVGTNIRKQLLLGNATLGDTTGILKLGGVNAGLTSYASNAAAVSAGLVVGDFYAITGTDPLQVAVVHA
jgi:hypothetical protein